MRTLGCTGIPLERAVCVGRGHGHRARSAWGLHLLPRGTSTSIETPINPHYLGEWGSVPNRQMACQVLLVPPQVLVASWSCVLPALALPCPPLVLWEPAAVGIHSCNSRSRSRVDVGVIFWGHFEKVREKGEQSGVLGFVS